MTHPVKGWERKLSAAVVHYLNYPLGKEKERRKLLEKAFRETPRTGRRAGSMTELQVAVYRFLNNQGVGEARLLDALHQDNAQRSSARADE